MNDFETMCESFGIIKKTTRVMYPRKIKISEQFLEALKKEYISQKMLELENSEMAVKDRPAAFIKAMMFHVSELDKNSAAEIDAMKRKLEEDTTYKTKEAGKKVEKDVTPVEIKKMDLRKKQIPLENMKKDMVGKPSACPCKTKKS